ARGAARERLCKRQLARFTPFQRERQQKLESRRAGLGLGERQVLAIVVDRRVVGADAIDHALLQAAREGVAIALTAQWRLEAAIRVEVAEVHLAEMQVMDCDIGGNGKSLAL